MIDFIITLEDLLTNSGREDWEIQYDPCDTSYLLTLDGTTVRLIKE